MASTAFLITLSIGVASAPSDIDNLDDAVTSVKDGQKNIMFVMNSNHAAEMKQLMTWREFLVLGAALIVLGIVIGIGLMCCWVNRQWDHMAYQVERAAINSARQVMREMVAASHNQTDRPPSYDDAMEIQGDIALEEMGPLNCSDLSVNITSSELGQ